MHRKRISVTVDPVLLSQVDAYVEEHPETDRSKVVDDALACWYAARQEEAMLEQYLQPPDAQEAAEMEAWRGIQKASLERLFQKWR